VCTAFHVVEDAVKFVKKWSPIAQREITVEDRQLVQVEVFKYEKLSRCVGGTTYQAEIVAWDKELDYAVLKLRTEEKFDHVAKLYPRGKEADIKLGREVIAAGCSLGHEPLFTFGNLVSKHDMIENKEYWMCTANTIFGNCLTADTFIMTNPDGVVSITQVPIGSHIIALNEGTGVFEPARVLDVVYSGKQLVYKLRTTSKTIKATSNHSFLTPYGWERLDQLKRGDRVRSISYIPAYATGLTENDGRIIGIFLGDGWMRDREGEGFETVFCLFLPKDRETINFIRGYLGGEGTLDDRGLHFYTKSVYERMVSLGLKQTTSKEKTMPPELFLAKPSVRLAFLKGLLETDGWVTKRGEWRFEMANEKLISDVKLLAESLGFHANGPYMRDYRATSLNSKGRQIKGGPTWTIVVYPWEQYLVNYDIVQEITPLGIEDTYDLKVENHHNFLANGLVVHNSGGPIFLADTYEYIGNTARVSGIQLGFGFDIITWMGFFIPMEGIYKFFDENFLQFIYDSRFTSKQCEEMRRKKMEEEEKKLILPEFEPKPAPKERGY